MTRPLTVSAPGSLMLLGEHAVLHGHPCLVAAVEQRVRVSLVPRNDGLVMLTSALGEYEGERDDLPDHPSFRFVLAVLRHHAQVLPGGMEVLITADMPATIGFGTSAAVTVAMCGAMHEAGDGRMAPATILPEARAIIQHVQGRGSGADAAASVMGGVVYYRMHDREPSVVTHAPHPIAALYCGYKTPTPEVIARVQSIWQHRPAEVRCIYEAMAAAVETGRVALAAGDAMRFGRALDEGQERMRELGVSTPELDTCVERLRRMPGVTGAKISGSGLGDCAIGWGAGGVDPDFEQFSTTTAREGMRVE